MWWNWKVKKLLFFTSSPVTPLIVYCKVNCFCHLTFNCSPCHLNLWYHITNSMVHGLSWQVDGCSVGQEISHFLWNLGGSLPCSQQPLIGPYFELIESSPHPISLSFILILSPHVYLGHLSGLFHSCFVTKTMYVFLMCATYLTPLILLDLIILIILGEEYKVWNYSLYI